MVSTVRNGAVLDVKTHVTMPLVIVAVKIGGKKASATQKSVS